MREVLAVRIFSLFAVTCLISGTIMNLSNSSEAQLQADNFFEADTEMATEDIAPIVAPESRDNTDTKSSTDKSVELILLGAGGFSSLLLGSLFSEIFKITVLVSLLTPLVSKTKSRNDLLTRGRILGYLGHGMHA